MSIRRTLLIAFLLFGVVAAATMTALAWSRSRAALDAEIRLNLESQAVTVMQQIEAIMFERVENVYGWSQLDLMQEIRLDDIDKRLSRFLRDIKSSYAGIYRSIVCVRDGRIVAAADPTLIGTSTRAAPTWLTVQLPAARVELARPDTTAGQPVLTVRAPLLDAFTGSDLGYLQGDYDWSEVQTLLDHTVAQSSRFAMLLDAGGRVLAASSAVRARPDLLAGEFASFASDTGRSGVVREVGTPLGHDRLLVGHAGSTGYNGLPDFGWRLLVLAPERVALQPVTHLLNTLLALLVLAAVVAAVLAINLSGRIARPIQALTELTRHIDGEIDQQPAPVQGADEVVELGRAFRRMIVDLRHSRAHLVRVSKLAAVGEMAAMLAHEVRNPLGIVRSSAQLLARQQGLDARGHEMVDFMVHECDRINALIRNLLENARPREPAMAEHDLRDIVRQPLEMLRARAQTKRVALEFDGAEQPLPIVCDRDQITQVLLNLVLNAIQMVADGGRIEIAAGMHDGAAWLEVRDDGPGIPAARHQLILEPFVTFRDGGIGLGLTIVQDILTRHGATLTIGTSGLGGASLRIDFAGHQTRDATAA
ncbi:MAG: sensor histidine kinase [Gammaproteobacteria bacterium]|nr:sensor histidine kinase [Gammaproteobacteria bacterium]